MNRVALRAAAAAAGAALAVWAAWIEPRRLVVRRETLELRHWPAALDGLRVGVMSDLHAGVPYMGLDAIARAVDRLNEEAPDLVVLLGDYLDASMFWYPPARRLAPERVADQLARLEAPLGRFAVLGNHDWKRGGDRMRIALETLGIPVLENRAVPVQAAGGRLWVAGLADMRHRRPDVGAALADVPPDEPVLLLSHDPDMHPSVPQRVALTLAGHVHAGQVAIPVLRRPAIPSHHGERYAHHHVVDAGRRLYVSSGLGTSGAPVRLLAPPEVVVLELRASR
jgi:predicted MPP superfamily phosphohydrolase